MSYIVEGAYGQDWQGSNWVFRHMSEHLLRVLQKTEGAEELAERLEEAVDIEIGYLDISDLLQSPKLSHLWSQAIEETIALLRSEGNADWREPDRFESFLTKVGELKSLAEIQQPTAA